MDEDMRDRSKHKSHHLYSSNSLKVYGKSWKIRFYGKKDFGGQAAECAEDRESVYEASFQFREALSSVAAGGARVLYEQPDYRGYTDRGATSPPLWGPSA